MPNPRRFIALLVFLFAALSAFAQSAPADTGGEKISLSDAIQRALAKNYAIKVQGYDAAIAAAGVTQALGKFDPVLNGNYTYSSNTNPAVIDPSIGLISPAGNVSTD